MDALHVHPEINVIFGINDDFVLGGLQAYLDLGRDPDQVIAVNVGGEGQTLFDELQRGHALRACLALFPEVVGRMAVDLAARLWQGEDVGHGGDHAESRLDRRESLRLLHANAAGLVVEP